jgi:hypothetical protein
MQKLAKKNAEPFAKKVPSLIKRCFRRTGNQKATLRFRTHLSIEIMLRLLD